MTFLHNDEFASLSTDSLISAALCETDDDARWDLIFALRQRGTREVLEAATQLCRSMCSFERYLGVSILAQLGRPVPTFPRECGEVLRAILKCDQDPDVLAGALLGLYHLGDEQALEMAVRFARHPAHEVRRGTVHIFSSNDSPVSVEYLIRLTSDPAATVRDWATFGLGTQMDADGPEIRQALIARLDDVDLDTRAEAIVGLARRGEGRVIPALRRELDSEQVCSLCLEAAEFLGAPDLVPSLESLRPWDEVAELLERAITNCRAGIRGEGFLATAWSARQSY